MNNEEWRKVARLAGYVYIPIGLLILFIFALVEYQSIKIERAKKETAIPLPATPTAANILPH